MTLPKDRTPKILVLDRGEELAAQLQALADEFRPAPEIVSCTRVGAVTDVLEAEGTVDVVVAGPSLGTRSGLARLGIVHEDRPGTSLVLAFSRRPDASLRDIVRTGACDILQLPIEDKELVDAVERAIQLSRAAPEVQLVEAATPAGSAPSQPPGKMYAVSSATGGCGKTFFATNLAYFLHSTTGKRACIVDLDLQFGEVSTALRLRPRFTIYDAVQRGAAEEDDLREHIEEYLVTHESGVHVLAAPREPAEADQITPPDVSRVLDALRRAFDYVVIDTPPQMNEHILAAFDVADMLYVMATLDLPSVRNMNVFLSTLERLKVASENVKLILNKAETDVGIDIDQVARLFPQGFETVLPYAKEVSRSINLGMPVMADSPQAEVSRLLAAGMRVLLPSELQEQFAGDGDAARKKGLFRRRRAEVPVG